MMAGLGIGFVPRQAIAIERKAGLLSEIAVDSVLMSRSLWFLKPEVDRPFENLERFCTMLEQEDWMPAALDLRPTPVTARMS